MSQEKPKYSFNIGVFILSLLAILVGLGLVFWQYLRWFNPGALDTSVRRLSIGLVVLTALILVGGVAFLIQSFKSGAKPTLIYLPKESYPQLKQAIESVDVKQFEKLLDGPTIDQGQKEYAALTIEYFKDQPHIATVQSSMRILHSSGSFFEVKNASERKTVQSSVIKVLKKIEKKYGSTTQY